MVKVMGENKVAAQARATGREASENELGVIISQIKKHLSLPSSEHTAVFWVREQRQQQGEGNYPGDWKWAEGEKGRPTSRLTFVEVTCLEQDRLSFHR